MEMRRASRTSRRSVLAVCCLVVGLAARPGIAQRLETTIYLPDSFCGQGFPRRVTYNPVNNTVYVGGSIGNCLIAIDGQTDTRVARIPVQGCAAALCVDTHNNQVYCASGGSNLITVVDCATNRAVTTIPVGDSPDALCYNSRSMSLV